MPQDADGLNTTAASRLRAQRKKARRRGAVNVPRRMHFLPGRPLSLLTPGFQSLASISVPSSSWMTPARRCRRRVSSENAIRGAVSWALTSDPAVGGRPPISLTFLYRAFCRVPMPIRHSLSQGRGPRIEVVMLCHELTVLRSQIHRTTLS